MLQDCFLSDEYSHQYLCLCCNQTFANKSALTFHVRSHIGQVGYRCTKCERGFTRASDQRRHSLTHREASDLRRHSLTHTEGSDLRRHSQTHSGSSNLRPPSLALSRMKLFQCKECHETFLNDAQLKRHKGIHSGAQYLKKPETHLEIDKNIEKEEFEFTKTKIRKKAFACFWCSKSFSEPSSLESHSLIHTTTSGHVNDDDREPSYRCGHCDQTFKWISHLIRHSIIHQDKKDHQCYQCEKTFTRNYNLLRHLKLHNGDRPYQCSKCSQTFKRESVFKRHRDSHLQDKEKEEQTQTIVIKDLRTGRPCEGNNEQKSKSAPEISYECNEGLAASQVGLHKKMEAGRKPYVCTQCGKSFYQKDNLTIHQQAHTKAVRALRHRVNSKIYKVANIN